MSSQESRILEIGTTRGPSTRRIKLLEEQYTEEAIQRASEHEEGTRDWARGENKPFLPLAEF